MEQAKPQRRVRSPYNPPGLILKQAFSLACQGWLTRWSGLPSWVLKGRKVISTAAGASAIGCTGYPTHIVWEITNRCNLNCIHCYAGSVDSTQNELTTAEGKRFLDQLAGVDEFRMIVVTGGEPLVRKDIFEFMEYAGRLGFRIIFSTNGTLLTPSMARDLTKMGVVNFSISLDGSTAAAHEAIRRIPGSFEKTLKGIRAAGESGACVQVNFTAMQQNFSELPRVIELAESLEVDLFMVFQSIPPRRFRGALELGPAEQRQLLETIRARQRKSRFLIMPVCSPQYWPFIAGSRRPGRLASKLLVKAFAGCGAGRGFCYVRFDGDVWPCNFIPTAAGNVRTTSIRSIWRDSPGLAEFRKNPRPLKGACRECPSDLICGGCRGRALAHSGDYLEGDPNCTLIDPPPPV